MVRLASRKDAEQLLLLNEAFNGEGTALGHIERSLSNNRQEVIVVAEEDGILVGFVCVQIKRSFCYQEALAELTEVFVAENYRRRRIASEMIAYAEAHCIKMFHIHEFALLTGKENCAAQALYRRQGYHTEDEVLMTKTETWGDCVEDRPVREEERGKEE